LSPTELKAGHFKDTLQFPGNLLASTEETKSDTNKAVNTKYATQNIKKPWLTNTTCLTAME